MSRLGRWYAYWKGKSPMRRLFASEIVMRRLRHSERQRRLLEEELERAEKRATYWRGLAWTAQEGPRDKRRCDLLQMALSTLEMYCAKHTPALIEQIRDELAQFPPYPEEGT